MSTPRRIAEQLEQVRLAYTSEDELQAALHEALIAAGIDSTREVQLSGDLGRIDLMAGTIGIEVKTKGSAISVTRQLLRYTHAPELTHLTLVTTRAKHVQAVNALPYNEPRIPITAVYLGEGGL